MRGVLQLLYADKPRRIRIGLLTTDGARVCPWCEVITQGGDAGLSAHVAVIHPERVQ